MLDKQNHLWYNTGEEREREVEKMKLDWMTEEQYDEIKWYWGCVCDYKNVWGNDYEGWCKRVLKAQGLL